MIESDKILFCSIETNQNGRPPHGWRIEESANRVGIEVKMFGGGWRKWENFKTKLDILLEELPKYKDEYDLILFTDARDVMYWRGKKSIMKALEKFKDYKMVINAETNCYPNKDLKEGQDKIESGKYRYLNSGMFIGDIDFVIDVLKKCNEDGLDDDQESFQNIYLDMPEYIKLDSNCELFQVMWDEEFGRSANFDIIFNNRFVYNKKTKTYPCIFHSPGPTGHLNQLEKITNRKFGKKYAVLKAIFLEQ